MKAKFKNFDWLLFLAAFLILCLGSVTIFSVNPEIFSTQLVYGVLSVAVFFVLNFIDFKIYEGLASGFYFLSLAILIIPLFIGVISRGATRWISLGGRTFQPSEAAKFLMIIFLARYWHARKITLNNLIICFFWLLPQFFLIFRQPDLGSSLVLLVIFGGILFFTELNWKQITALLLVIIIFLPFSWLFLKDYQKLRITNFINPNLDPLGSGYNIIQSILTVGSGGLLGKGLGKGTQSHLAFLPERHTDFIFSSFAEEFGFLGSVILLLLYFFLAGRILLAARKAKDSFAFLICAGVFSLIFFQTTVNIGMNLGLLPITGITLPLFSYGGSSLISTMACLGLVSNISGGTLNNSYLEIGSRN